MKNKILLEVYLPASGKSFDVKVPRQLKIAQVTTMLIDFLKKQDEEFIPGNDSVLCEVGTGKAFDSNAFIEMVGLHNGSRIMLI